MSADSDQLTIPTYKGTERLGTTYYGVDYGETLHADTAMKVIRSTARSIAEEQLDQYTSQNTRPSLAQALSHSLPASKNHLLNNIDVIIERRSRAALKMDEPDGEKGQTYQFRNLCTVLNKNQSILNKSESKEKVAEVFKLELNLGEVTSEGPRCEVSAGGTTRIDGTSDPLARGIHSRLSLHLKSTVPGLDVEDATISTAYINSYGYDAHSEKDGKILE